MEEKSKIIHFIDTLSVGGAETLLKNTVSILPEFHHIIIYLNEPHTIKFHILEKNVEFICLDYQRFVQLPSLLFRLKKIIKKTKPLLVHSHLFYSTLLARLSVPKDIPLISTLHSMYSVDAFEKNRFSAWAERMTLKERHHLVGVSKYVLEDYLRYIAFDGKSFVLYNFLPDRFFEKKMEKSSSTTIKCIAVGNLKEAKNYGYLLNIFKDLKHTGASLDIYGDGSDKEMLNEIIKQHNLPVRLCGLIDDVKERLDEYDLFIQASSHEGFGLSVVEAMARRIPIVVSDLEVFRETTHGAAHFFPLNDAPKAASLLISLFNNKQLRNQFIEEAFYFSKTNYCSNAYKQSLLNIYNSLIKTNS
jgi:glycosyltransferase involved in cell wall biosynthesis